jgi:hypothetical protein
VRGTIMSDVNTYEEISLFDIWRIVVKNKKTFWLAFLLVFIFGGLTILTSPKKYEFSQVINLANYMDDAGRVTLVESVDYIKSRMSSISLPAAVNTYNSAHGANINSATIAISVDPVNDVLLNLSAKGSINQQGMFTELFSNIISQLKAETNPTIQEHKQYLAGYLSSLEGQWAMLNKRNENGSDVGTKFDNTSESIAKLFLIASFQNRANLLLQVLDRVKDTKFKLNLLHPTAVVTTFFAKPIGPSRMVLMILLAVVGAIVGFFAVFIREFLVKFKQQSVE